MNAHLSENPGENRNGITFDCEKMLWLGEILLVVEDDRAKGNCGCTVEELDN